METSERGVEGFLTVLFWDGDEGQLRLRLGAPGWDFWRGELQAEDGLVSSHTIDMSLSER